MALSAATDRRKQLTTDTLIIPVAAGKTIYPNGNVCTDADGYAVAAADTANYVYEGVAEHQTDEDGNRVLTDDNEIDNSAGSDGDVYVMVRRTGRFRFDTAETVDQSAMSAQAYIEDDDTVACDADSVTNDIECGRIVRVIDSGTVEVEIDDAVRDTSRSYSAPTTTTTTAAATTTTTSAA